MTLHDDLVAAVTERLELARAALEFVRTQQLGGWPWMLPDAGPVSRFITANDPAIAIRACEADLKRLGEHRPMAGDPRWCMACTRNSGVETATPCAEIRRIARVYGAEVDTE